MSASDLEYHIFLFDSGISHLPADLWENNLGCINYLSLLVYLNLVNQVATSTQVASEVYIHMPIV